MESFEIDPVKAEKAMAMRRYRRIQKLANIFRCVEVFVGLVFLTWISFRLPIAIKISGDISRQLLNLIVSPRFVFLLGNAIIITLVAKSGQFSGNGSSGCSTSASDLYEEFLKNSESSRGAKVRTDQEEEEVVYQDKAVCAESRREGTAGAAAASGSFGTSSCTVLPNKRESPRKRRSERVAAFAETRKPAEVEYRCGAAETRVVEEKCGEEEESCFKTEMSNEEFRLAVEAFIAKQQRFQRQESMAIVVHDTVGNLEKW
ncbi:hypothetical protein H6P81_009669 [Aristolochia fimbriata]|uniref:DUF4408 domain-containing protein n=1 Tax=Aristolochia fimbriata TaxID=158543 RepID=A0AAV7EM50_ARIFI|nr:hypothetical protein H6P81_009669 [Aristolochia fimbriata]